MGIVAYTMATERQRNMAVDSRFLRIEPREQVHQQPFPGEFRRRYDAFYVLSFDVLCVNSRRRGIAPIWTSPARDAAWVCSWHELQWGSWPPAHHYDLFCRRIAARLPQKHTGEHRRQ